jgi:RES domain-containing protein
MITTAHTVSHNHVPLYRVVRRGWADPLDTSYSQRASADNRWNTPVFAALYCSCSERVARAVVRDVFRLAGIESADLQPGMLPQLVEIDWTGDVVDVASPEGVAAAGFPPDYPVGIEKTQTRATAKIWHDSGAAGVVARSASLMRLGFHRWDGWDGDHEAWSETTVFVDNSASRPTVQRRRNELDWLVPPVRLLQPALP